MKIELISEEFIQEQIAHVTKKGNHLAGLLWSGKDLSSQRNQLARRTFLGLSEDGNSTHNEAKLLEIVLVQYLPDSNCGFVRFLSLKRDVHEEQQYSWRLQKALMEEAVSVLYQDAKGNGCNGISEIFSYIDTGSDTRKCFQKSLYDRGFRLVETHSLNHYDNQDDLIYTSCLLTYRPYLCPNYQIEDGVLFDHVEASVLLQFIKELRTVSDDYWPKTLLSYIATLEETSLAKIDIRPSFPWHGTGEASFDNRVAVVGGGVAGLAAAASLSEAGFDVVLLEAANYLGGRVKQVQPFKGFPPVDLGGEFIHGSNTIINRIAEENGWAVEPCNRCDGMELADQYYYNGELFPVFSTQPDIQTVWRAWDQVIALGEKMSAGDKIRNTENDETVKKIIDNTCLMSTDGDRATFRAQVKPVVSSIQNGVVTKEARVKNDDARLSSDQHEDMSVLEWLKLKQCSDDVIAVFDTMYCQTMGAALHQMGLFESAREEHEWGYGHGNYRLIDSYSLLVKHLLDKCTAVDKRLHWQGKKIVWKDDNRVQSGDPTGKGNSGDRILITNQHGELITAKYVIITVPLTILKDGDITFIPGLPSNKLKAIETIQMRGGLKIVCRFKERFWPHSINLIYCVRGFVSQIWMYTRDSAEGDEQCHVVIGFLTAEPAEEKVKDSGKDVLDQFLKQLDQMFGTEVSPQPASELLMDYLYYNWSTHPFVRGGYSSPTCHAYDLRHELAKSVDDHLFFAGEATSVTVCATVHTAIETGLRAAREKSWQSVYMIPYLALFGFALVSIFCFVMFRFCAGTKAQSFGIRNL